MSAATVITGGYGTFGSVSFVITEGFGDYGDSPVVAETYSGGFLPHARAYPSKEEIRRQRERLGILPREAEVIEAVAARQAEDLQLDEQQRFEELTREFTLRGMEFRAQHLELLNQRREMLIEAEIARLMQIRRDDDEIMLLLLITAMAAK